MLKTEYFQSKEGYHKSPFVAPLPPKFSKVDSTNEQVLCSCEVAVRIKIVLVTPHNHLSRPIQVTHFANLKTQVVEIQSCPLTRTYDPFKYDSPRP